MALDDKEKIEVMEKIHETPIDIQQLTGTIETITTFPSYVPKKPYDQIKIYVNSLSSPSVYRLVVYATGTNTWISAVLT